ncbi:hypothetical protein JCM10908_004603 [Rhodotorula pacifica]|uniref:uncharacterized protein n=1 Tax=Rhodotorula pacifica TaxID=1495444 RepID=UPI0031713B3E
MLSQVLVASALAGTALAQSSAAFTPLAAKSFDYYNLPYQADTDDGVRGRQLGYNRCNSTTENQDSLCQTAIINSIDDFCFWAPPRPNETVGDIEGEMVAWCTKEGHGTRIIPEGALQGVQFIQTPHYVQVVGYIDQVKIDLLADDYGGEMDPHGADQRGNPLGGLLFSNAFAGNSTTNGTAGGQRYQQFCLKACDPSYENGWAMCEHIFDRIGCVYNAPSTWSKINGTFESCKGDDQLYPGQYVEGGVTRTYTQPPESLGVISTIPYTPFTPSSSECTPYTSSAIYTAGRQLAVATSSASSSASSASTTSGASSASASRSGASASASRSGASAGASGSQGAQGASQSGTPASGAIEGFKVAGGLIAVVAGMIGAVAAL